MQESSALLSASDRVALPPGPCSSAAAGDALPGPLCLLKSIGEEQRGPQQSHPPHPVPPQRGLFLAKTCDSGVPRE